MNNIFTLQPPVSFSGFAMVIGLMFISSQSLAKEEVVGNIEAGKTKSTGCLSCHGVAGIAPAPNFPNLAGQKALYLKTALTAYRDGGRKDPFMNAMARPLTDTNIANLAAYYSSLPQKNDRRLIGTDMYLTKRD